LVLFAVKKLHNPPQAKTAVFWRFFWKKHLADKILYCTPKVKQETFWVQDKAAAYFFI
jgi:hypothetical protein